MREGELKPSFLIVAWLNIACSRDAGEMEGRAVLGPLYKMLRGLRRSFYLKNAPGHAQYKAAYLDKRPYKLLENDFDDPLSIHRMPKHQIDRNRQVLGDKIAADFLLKHPSLSLSSSAVGFLAFRCSRWPEHNPVMWDLLEYHMGKKLEVMTPRVLYGCYYGFLRTGLCSQLSFKSLHADFLAKAWAKVNPFECYELLEAASFCPKAEINDKKFLLEEVLAKLNHFWKRAGFAHDPAYLRNLIKYLYKLNLFHEVPELWSNVVGVLGKKKHFRTLSRFADLHALLLQLRKDGFEQKTGQTLDPIFDSFAKAWEADANFQWRYNLSQGRYYTASEMVENAKSGPETLTWEAGDAYIQHRLPQWYVDGNTVLEPDVADMLQEYYLAHGEFSLRRTKGPINDLDGDDDDKEVKEEGEEGEEGEQGENAEGEAGEGGEGESGQEDAEETESSSSKKSSKEE